MNTGIVLCRSKYGAARRYADWVAQETGFFLADLDKGEKPDLSPYGAVVLCGGVYASSVGGVSFLKKRAPQLEGKQVAVFAVGASPWDEKSVEELRRKNLTGPLAQVPLFYGRGAWDESRMTLLDRTLCRGLQRAVARKDPATLEPWEAALLSARGTVCDWTDRASLAPLLDYLAGGHTPPKG